MKRKRHGAVKAWVVAIAETGAWFPKGNRNRSSIRAAARRLGCSVSESAGMVKVFSRPSDVPLSAP